MITGASTPAKATNRNVGAEGSDSLENSTGISAAMHNLQIQPQPVAEDECILVVRAAPGRGLGSYAHVDIRRGTRIISAPPLFQVTETYAEPPDPAEVERAFRALSVEERRDFVTLASPHRPDRSLVMSIYEANSFRTDASHSGIFLRASRINHSCVPSACFSFNHNLGRLTIHAIVDIPAGHEITISYIPPYGDRSHRHEVLAIDHVFTCQCPACQPNTPFGQASETRRQRMMELNRQLVAYDTTLAEGDPVAGKWVMLPWLLEMSVLLREEGLVHLELSDLWFEIARCFWTRGRAPRAIAYAWKKLVLDRVCLGPDSPGYRHAQDHLAFLWHHFPADGA